MLLLKLLLRVVRVTRRLGISQHDRIIGLFLDGFEILAVFGFFCHAIINQNYDDLAKMNN